MGRAERDRQARREALARWTEEIGPLYLIAYRSPAELRTIATQMARAARALRAQATRNDRRATT